MGAAHNPPVKDIPAVLRKVTRGTPQEQNDALKAYFLPNAALEGPLLRVPPMSDMDVSYLGIVNSRRLIYVLCRLSKLLVRTLEFDIKSAGKDPFPLMSCPLPFQWNTHTASEDNEKSP